MDTELKEVPLRDSETVVIEAPAVQDVEPTKEEHVVEKSELPREWVMR